MVLEELFRAEITLAAPQELGDTPQGRRRIIGITGGRFTGGRLRHGPPEVLATGARRAASVELEVFQVL